MKETMMGGEAGGSPDTKSLFDGSDWFAAENVSEAVAKAVAVSLRCDQVHVSLINRGEILRGAFVASDGSEPYIDSTLFTVGKGAILYRSLPILAPLFVNDLQRARLPGDLSLVLAAKGVRSMGLIPLRRDSEVIGVVACYYQRAFHRWSSKETHAFEEIVEHLPPVLGATQAPVQVNQSGLRSQYQRLASHGNLVIITTDEHFRVLDIFGNTEALLGVRGDSMRGDANLWQRVLDPRDAQTLQRKIMRIRRTRGELRAESRVVHQRTGEIRWLMLRALPQFSEAGTFTGWEGFGVDVTDRREAQDKLVDQNRRLEALFEVARSLHGYADPATVTFRGLRALMSATQSHIGYACFFDRTSRKLELVASVGLSEQYLDSMEVVLRGPSLLRRAVESQKPVFTPNLQEEPGAIYGVARIENIKAAIMMPLTADGEVYGAIVLAKRESHAYKNDDFEVAAAAASQITLAIRQAALFEEQRRTSKSLRSLYKVSSELAKHRSTLDFGVHVFPVLKEEFALKRGWLGVLNEQGTVIAGKAGFGLEAEGSAAQAQLEISGQSRIVEQVVGTKQPLIVNEFEPRVTEPLVEMFQNPNALVIVPMVAIGQLMGILVVEPLSKNTFASPERMRLLLSMTQEIATVILAGRFEHKMAEAMKMRMAGLLASGVAHNFNNLLQGILGQVALIEMQTPKGSSVLEASQTITEAAKRGASLVSQLLNFAANSHATKKVVSLGRMVSESEELYRSLIGKRIRFSIDVAESEASRVMADASQIQQVITNMLVNAKDAIGSEAIGAIEVSLRVVSVRPGELAPDISPGQYVRLDIKDNGLGMSPEQQARCFEPFYTTKNVDRGTGVGLSGSGLGLSTAYSIVKQHDGLITIHSKPGEGTLFSIYLPVSAGVTASSEPTEERVVGVTPRGALLLGMESGVQPFVSSILDSLGRESRGVFDGRQAMEVLRKEPGRWGVVMIDMDSLGTHALTVSTQLLSTFSELYIIGISAAGSSRGARGAFGTSDARVRCIEKPITVWSVEAVLRELTAHEEQVASSVALTQG